MVARLTGRQAQSKRALSKGTSGDRRAGAVRDLFHCEAGRRAGEQCSVFADPGNDFADATDLLALALRLALPFGGAFNLSCSSR